MTTVSGLKKKMQTGRAMEAVDVLLKFRERKTVDFDDVMNSRKIRSEENHFKPQKKKADYFVSPGST